MHVRLHPLSNPMNAVLPRTLPPPSVLVGSVNSLQRLVFVRPTRQSTTTQKCDHPYGLPPPPPFASTVKLLAMFDSSLGSK